MSPTYWIETHSLDTDGRQVAVRHDRPFPASRWENVSEQQALQAARGRADELRRFHSSVQIVRVGPRGGRRIVR
ncbi:hypothetical protein ACIOG4_27740 [Streptomyces microflavus]|uniref:hypothetical protein n=1 Tax=Streptomyces microflavus TaxID=1919 RepID=UPI00380632E4